MLTRKNIDLENTQIVIYDNVFSYQENLEIFQFVCQQPFIRSNVDNTFDNNKDTNIKWSCLLKESNQITNLLNSKYFNLEEFKNKRFEIFRQYINFSTSETVDIVHVDSPTNTPGGKTILQYANYCWNRNWHGETVFYNSDVSEIIYSTMMKPGRVVIFDSNIPHSARAPSKLADYARYTIATKLLMIDTNE